MAENHDKLLIGVLAIIAILVAGILISSYLQGQSPTRTWYSPRSSTYTQSGAMTASSIGFPVLQQSSDRRLISVSGSVTKSVAPDMVSIMMSVQTLDKSASVSQSRNSDISDAVRKALKAVGVQDADIQTISYTLAEDFVWNGVTQKSESNGFRTTNTIEVKTSDLSKTGGIIDAAVGAGVNSVGSVQFTLSPQKESDLRAVALKEASADAVAKATSISAGFGAKLGDLWYASEGSSVIPYYGNPGYKAMASGAPTVAPTQITPGDVKMTVNVEAQFVIDQ